jgi:hypothetical protein
MFSPDSTLVGFDGTRRIARGTPVETALQAASYLAANPGAQLLFFDVRNGLQVELDLRGTADSIRQRMQAGSAQDSGATDPKPGKGRPRLGVVAREVTLLPRHWDWLAGQPGGASVSLRKLVEAAMRKPDAQALQQQRATAAYQLLLATAGNLPGFEALSRALFANRQEELPALLQDWPQDLVEEVQSILQARGDTGPQDEA